MPKAPSCFPAGHPVELAEKISALAGEAVEFEFSKYIYRPRSTVDDREYFRVASPRVSSGALELWAGLGPSQELGFHSHAFFTSGRVAHIPMLDLHGKISSLMEEGVSAVMCEFGIEEWQVYETGRSAHVYGIGLISHEDLVRFWGRALLLNLPEKEPVVDARWIGHRLMAGYGSLRWSCNTGQYLQMPKLI